MRTSIPRMKAPHVLRSSAAGIRGSIRAQLVLSFALVTLVTALAVGTGATLVSFYSARQQATERLESVAARKESALRERLRSVQQELVVASNTEGEFEHISIVLDLAGDHKYYDFYNKAVLNRLRRFVAQSQQLTEIFLRDRDGNVVLSTATGAEAGPGELREFYEQGLRGVNVQFPLDDAGSRSRIAVVAMPVLGSDGSPLGVIGARTRGSLFADILDEQTGLAGTGSAYLLDAKGLLLSESAAHGPSLPDPRAQVAGARNTLAEAAVGEAQVRRGNYSGLNRDHRGVLVIGVYRWLPDLGLLLAVEQDFQEAFRSVSLTVAISLIAALAGVLLATIVSLLVGRSIAQPLANLVDTATGIAGGDLTRVAEAERTDEIGALGRAFNSMTAQLRDLISTLERRVSSRTSALQRRALQLETSIRVSREISSILDVDQLLDQMVRVICNAFGYYEVHVFLLNPTGDELTLYVGSGRERHDSNDHAAVGPQVQCLDMDEATSLNVRALQTGEPQVVNDVTAHPAYLSDPGLPETRSELVVPLRLGDKMVGTLDVYSTEVNAFSEEDIRVMEGLSAQIAVAIENARLYDRSRALAVLEERNRLARELHDSVTQSLYSVLLLTEGWRRMASMGSSVYAQDTFGRIADITNQALKEMRLLINELRPPALERDGLVGALRQRLDAVERRAGVDARVVMEELIELPPRVEDGLYRISQEALNNALKHAGATQVTVRLCLDAGDVILEISDNGRGFDVGQASQSGGMGLDNMRERAVQLGGSLEIVSAPGHGATIRVRAPLERPGAGSSPVGGAHG